VVVQPLRAARRLCGALGRHVMEMERAGRRTEALEPGGPLDPRLGDLLEWRDLAPWRHRLLILSFLAIGAFGGLYGGFALAHEWPHWVTLAISALVLEPIGLACLAGLSFLVLPTRATGLFLSRVMPRAARAALLVGGLYAGVVLGLVLYALYEYWSVA
jgi:hypothetical protein